MGDWWDGYPWREIQTNLREIDMLDIDADRVVADLQEFKATVLMLNTAGIIASYPTQLPFHFQSPFLRGSSLADIVAACHRAGIRVIARTDFSKVRRPIYEAHPEWAYVSPKGEIVDYNGDVHVCVNSAYQQEYALKIIEEALTTIDLDGIFFNMGGYQVSDYSGNYYGICQCGNCSARFAKMYGLQLPKVADMADPVYRRYLVFKRETLRQHHEKVYGFVSGLRPGICIANHREFRRGIIRQESNTAVDRPLPHWQYSASDNTKWAVSSYPEMISSNTTVDFVDIPYRHVAVSPHQQKLRLAQSLANGGALDYYLIGRLDNHEDKSGYEGVREMFHYHAAHESEYRNLVSKATIAILHGPDADESEFRGWFRFLAESHFLFDTLMAEAAMDLPWNKYRAFIVPNYQPISNELAARLDSFAEAGGTVISIARSGLRDDQYERRAVPPLNCLGIERIGTIRTEMRSAYFRLDNKDGFSRFPVTDLIYLDGEYIYAEYAASVQRHCKLIPPHMFGPPERCYYTVVTDHPAFTVNPCGNGQGIYIPWKPGALFYRQGHTNTLDFVADLLQNIAGLRPLGGNLSPMVEVTLFESRGSGCDLLHLVNGSGHFGVTFYAPVTMSDVQVSCPYEDTPRSVASLVTGRTYDFSYQDGMLRIRIPSLGLFEAIKITR